MHSTAAPTPVVMLHGAWHGPWTWENWKPLFEKAGYEVRTPQLPGTYGEFRKTSFTDLLQSARQIVDDSPRPPILIGHSLGGYVIQHLMAERRFPGAVLVASVPSTGFPPKMMARSLLHPISAAKALTTNDLRHFVDSAATIRQELFSPDTPEETITDCMERLGHASLGLFAQAKFKRPKPPLPGTPTLVLAGSRDANISISHQRKLAVRLDGILKITQSAHDITLDKAWLVSAQAVIAWLESL